MTELLTAAQMRAIEEAAIASGEVTGLELMERAGRGVVAAMLDWRPELATAPHRAVVLCGPGNNGGDGFVVARLLKQRGWEVEVFLYGDVAKLPPDAAENCRRWREMGELHQISELGRFSVRPHVVVDAIFGSGLTRPLADEIDSAVTEFDDRDHLDHDFNVIAIDAPSGVCMDSGRVLGDGLRVLPADLTVTFHRARVGHYTGNGPELCGALRVVDIGCSPYERCIGASDERVVLAPSMGDLFEEPVQQFAFGFRVGKISAEHKYGYGHALAGNLFAIGIEGAVQDVGAQIDVSPHHVGERRDEDHGDHEGDGHERRWRPTFVSGRDDPR